MLMPWCCFNNFPSSLEIMHGGKPITLDDDKIITVEDLEIDHCSPEQAPSKEPDTSPPSRQRGKWLQRLLASDCHYADSAEVYGDDCEIDDGEAEDDSRRNRGGKMTEPVSRFDRLRRRLATHWRNSKVAIVWLVLYIMANLAAFFFKVLQYANNRPDARAVFGCYIMIARGAANCLNLNCALILLPMCRHTLTKVRGFQRIRYLFPLDSMTAIHRIIGCAIAFWVVVHVLAHMGDFYNFSHAREDDIVALMGGKLGIESVEDVPQGAMARWALVLQTPAAITGVIMVLCMIVAYGCVILQARLGYNMFWYTHHLLIVMLVALCFHGIGGLLEPFQSIYWIGFPLVLYGLPRLWRECVCADPPQLL